MLIIDGDLLVFKAAAYWQDSFKWEDTDEEDCIISNEENAWHLITDRLNEWIQEFPDHDSYTICFSSSSNFRKEIFPEYKAHRKKTAKPQALKTLIQRVKDSHPSEEWKNLEADDVLGILCTRFPDSIAVTEDKDQATVPGLWWNPRHPDRGVVNISVEQANYNHLVQTMAGDSSDGYKGIPRVGPKTAEKILAEAKEEWLDPWSAVVMAYHDKGMTTGDAVINARMAFILRDGYYNKKTSAVKLWEPTAGVVGCV